jgi:hypothetical protein
VSPVALGAVAVATIGLAAALCALYVVDAGMQLLATRTDTRACRRALIGDAEFMPAGQLL